MVINVFFLIWTMIYHWLVIRINLVNEKFWTTKNHDDSPSLNHFNHETSIAKNHDDNHFAHRSAGAGEALQQMLRVQQGLRGPADAGETRGPRGFTMGETWLVIMKNPSFAGKRWWICMNNYGKTLSFAVKRWETMITDYH